MTLHKVGNELRHHLGAPCVGQGTANPAKPPCEMVVNANGEMQVIHTGCGCASPGAVAPGGSTSTTMSGASPFGNHYIPEGMQPKMILVNSDSAAANRVISGVATLDPLRGKEMQAPRFEPPASRNVMTLSARPPWRRPLRQLLQSSPLTL